MSQAKKVLKFQNSGKLPSANLMFKLDGEDISIPETELNDFYVNYRNSLGGKAKNEQDWNKDYTEFVGRVKAGQQSKQYYSLNTGAGETVSATVGMPSENEDRGFKKNGKVATEGVLGNVTGIQRESVRDSAIIGALGSWLSSKRTSNSEAATKAAADEELKKKEAIATEDARLAPLYGDYDNMMNIGTSFYGRKLNTTDDQARTYVYGKYWEGDDTQRRKGAIDYLKNLSIFSDNADYQSEAFNKQFATKHGMDHTKFRANLKGMQFDNPDFDVEAAYSSLGLDPQYRALNDKSVYEALMKAKNVATQEALPEMADGFNIGEDGLSRLYFGNKLYSGLHTDNKYYKDGILGTGKYGDLEYDLGNLRSGMYNGLRYLEGAKFTGIDQAELDNFDVTEWGDVDVYQDGVGSKGRDFVADAQTDWAKLNSPIYQQLAQAFKAKYDATYDNNSFDRSIIDNRAGRQESPYFHNSDVTGVLSVTDLTDQFSNLLSDSSDNGDGDGSTRKFNAALVQEKMDKAGQFGNELRYRYFSAKGEHVGKIIADPRNLNNKIFVSEKDPNFRVELGVLTGKQTEIKRRLYSFKGPNGPNDAKTTMGGFQNWALGEWDFLKDAFAGNQKKESKENVAIKKDGGTIDYKNIKLPKFQNGGISTRTQSTYTMDKESQYGVETVLGDSDYKMTGADYAQLSALTADIAGLGLAFVPGANVASAATGLAGSVANYTGETMRDGEWFSNLGGLLMNVGLDAATLMPVAGGGAKTAKVMKGLKTAAPYLTTAFAAAGLHQSATALAGIISGKDSSMGAWRQLASGLTAVVGGGNYLGQKTLGYKKGPTESVVKIKTKNGQTTDMQLSEVEYKQMTMMDTNAAKSQFLKDLAVKNNIAESVDEVEIAAKDAVRKGVKFWNWEKASDSGLKVDISKQKQVIQPGESNSFRRYFAKHEALSNINAPGADGWRGGYRVAGKTAAELKPGQRVLKPQMFNEDAMPSPWSLGHMFNYKKGVSKADAIGIVKMSPKFELRPNTIEANQPNWGPTNGPFPNPSINGRVAPKPPRTVGRMTDPKGKFVNPSKVGPQMAVAPAPVTPPIAPGPSGGSSKTKVNSNGIKLKSKSETGKNQREVSKQQSQIQKKLQNSFANSKNKPPIKRKYQTGGLMQISKFQGGAKFDPWGLNTVSKIASTKIQDPIKNALNSTIKMPFSTPRNDSMTKNFRTTVPIAKIIKPTMNNAIPNGILNRQGVFIPKVAPKMTTKFMAPGVPPGPKVSSATDTTDPLASPAKVVAANGKGIMVDPTTMSEFARALYNRQVSEGMNSATPIGLSSQVEEVYMPVKGDFLTQQATKEASNRLRMNAGSPMSTDAAVQQAMQLSASTRGAEMEMQGASANSQAIKQQEMQNAQLAGNYAQNRAAVANDNVKTMAARDNAVIGKDNAKRLAKAQSLDNFWTAENMKSTQKDLQNQKLHNEMSMLNVGSNVIGEGFSETAWVGKSLDSIDQDIAKKMNAIPAAEWDLPIHQATREDLRRQSLLLQKERQKFGYEGLINNPYSNKVKLFGFKKGGRLALGEQKELINYRENVKNETQWVRDYNKFMSVKMTNDTKAAIAQNKSIQEIVKIALKKK